MEKLIKAAVILFLTFFNFSLTAATYTVTSTANGTTVDGASLRWAITQATATADKIYFNITGNPPHTITLTTALPTISTSGIIIDGTTQPVGAYTGVSPKIVIDGGGLIGTGLNNSNTNMEVYGLLIKGFTNYAVFSSSTGTKIGAINKGNVISGNGDAATDAAIYIKSGTIKGNIIGLDITGTAAQANVGYGIYINAATVTVGSGTSGEGNTISGNTSHGIYLNNADNSVIKGNKFGTNAAGTSAIGNGGSGIYSTLTGSMTIGGAAAGEGNVVSGNSSYGMYLSNANFGFVYGNYVGTDATGTSAIANGIDGIRVTNSTATLTIGGSAAGQGNVISGNTSCGIYYDVDTDTSPIKGNKIGTGANGTTNIGNGSYGVFMNGTSIRGNVVGGTAAGESNIIAYNSNAGVGVFGLGDNSTDANGIRRNSFFCNWPSGSKLGIDLSNTGNDNMAAPVITSATGSTVTGTSVASATIEIFLSDITCGCQGKTYVTTVTANASGSWSATGTFSHDVVATASDGANSTSEFSNCSATGAFALPIKIAIFSAKLVENSVYLSWSTSSETNNAYFTMEKTTDGNTYEFIGTVTGAGNSSKWLNYNLIDNKPLTQVTYYRLKQTDYDGKFTYSPLVAVNKSTITEMQIYPNPSNGKNMTIALRGVERKSTQLAIYNITGQQVYAQSIIVENDNFSTTILLPESLNSGIYIVVIKNEIYTLKHKLIVN